MKRKRSGNCFKRKEELERLRNLKQIECDFPEEMPETASEELVTDLKKTFGPKASNLQKEKAADRRPPILDFEP